MGSQYFSLLSEVAEHEQVELERSRRNLVCRWCDNPVKFVPRRGWVHSEGSWFVLHCPRCQRNTGSHSSQADCRHCGYNIGDNHLAEPRS